MRIVAIADTHKEYKKLKLPEGDILIHAGDFDVYRYDEELKHLNWWLGELNFKYKIVIAGNHDGYCEDKSVRYIEQHLTNAIYLENTAITIKDIKIYGSPITPKFGKWAFMRERGKQINSYWQMIPKDTDILITHGPPYEILDKTSFHYGGKNAGCSDLRDIVLNKVRPKYHIFGHIHNGYGTKKINGTTFINCSVMDEEYNLVNKPIIFNYEKGGKNEKM